MRQLPSHEGLLRCREPTSILQRSLVRVLAVLGSGREQRGYGRHGVVLLEQREG